MLNDLFEDIAGTCFRNGLTLEYMNHVKRLEVRKIHDDCQTTHISGGYIADWMNESDEDTLNRILKEVNNYVEGK